jgi:hypothetical protein
MGGFLFYRTIIKNITSQFGGVLNLFKKKCEKNMMSNILQLSKIEQIKSNFKKFTFLISVRRNRSLKKDIK